MTRIDALAKSRNSLIAVILLCAAISFGAIYIMAWWVTPLDYWLMWASIATGIAALITSAVALSTHAEMIDAQRTDRTPT